MLGATNSTEQRSRTPQISHRRDAEAAEEEGAKQTSLRTLRLCGETSCGEILLVMAGTAMPPSSVSSGDRRGNEVIDLAVEELLAFFVEFARDDGIRVQRMIHGEDSIQVVHFVLDQL